MPEAGLNFIIHARQRESRSMIEAGLLVDAIADQETVNQLFLSKVFRPVAAELQLRKQLLNRVALLAGRLLISNEKHSE